MAAERWLALAILAVCALPNDLFAAELPSQNKKTKPAEAVRRCDIAGSPGVLANGVCVRISGYVSAGFSAGRLK